MQKDLSKALINTYELKQSHDPWECLVSKIQTYKRTFPKVGRNEICPCGSRKKFKKCCLSRTG